MFKSYCILPLAAAMFCPLRAAPPEIDAVAAKMRDAVEAGEVAGVVTLVADPEKILHLSASGFSDLATRAPMTEDALFWIASMTKPVTGAAVMMMQDEGLLAVEDPVSKYLAEFAHLKDEAGNEVNITIQQCLSHTSGLSELSPEELAACTTLEDCVARIVAKPVKFPPGSKWMYSQTSMNMAARVVEVVSGKRFPEFLQERLFGPLGMADTGFYPDEILAARLATSYLRTEAGDLKATPLRFLNGSQPSHQARVPLANGGLFSTARDYATFAQMILNEGESGGKRYLTAESVRQMTRVQSGELTTGFTPGNGWGLGWCVVREPQGASAALSPGSFGHGGAYGTQAWVDPSLKKIYLLMVQHANFPNSDASDIRREFQKAAATGTKN